MDTIFEHLRLALESGNTTASLFALMLAYLGGVLSSFTPCIYPMIPITIGFIGGTTERSVKMGLVLSGFYVLGMAVVYSVLGIVASLSGKIFGTMTNTAGWYLVLGAIMLGSALWMMGVIKLDPNVIMAKVLHTRTHHRRATVAGIVERNEGTILGAFVLGITSGFVASPCTTPVLTTILSYIANEKSVVFGGLLMFCFALGLGTILVLVGTFTGAMKILPKSGLWMERIKLFSGLLILVLAEYFIFKAGALR